MNKKYLYILLIIFIQKYIVAQIVDTIYIDSIPKKIIYDKKIYKLNSGFASVGVGGYTSNQLNYLMKGFSLDINIHTFKQYFLQFGFSRIVFDESFNYPDKKSTTIRYFNFHLSPLCVKTENVHFAFVFNPIGIAYGGGYKDDTYYFNGILLQDSTNTIHSNYFAFNYYSSIQAIYKFKYDLGIGAEMYAEYSEHFLLFGLKATFYFCGSYMGKKPGPDWYKPKK